MLARTDEQHPNAWLSTSLMENRIGQEGALLGLPGAAQHQVARAGIDRRQVRPVGKADWAVVKADEPGAPRYLTHCDRRRPPVQVPRPAHRTGAAQSTAAAPGG